MDRSDRPREGNSCEVIGAVEYWTVRRAHGIEFKGEELAMERMVYGSAAMQTVLCSTRPQMATFPPRSFEPASPRWKEGRAL